MKKTILFGLIWFAVIACDSKNDSNPAPHAELKTAVVSNKQETSFRTSDDELKAKLTSVADSRCPMNVTCIVAGSANLTFNVSDGTSQTDVSVVFSSDGKNSGNQEFKLGSHTYNLTVTTVLPYPETSRTPTLEEYEVSVSIEKK